MKTNTCARLLWILYAVALTFDMPSALAAAANEAADPTAAKPAAAIPWSQIGAKAGADYQGDGLGVNAVGEGARLRCVFQRLEGEATSEGLWLTSTATNTVNERFRVMVSALGRHSSNVGDEVTSLTSPTSIHSETPHVVSYGMERFANSGAVEVADKLVRFLRPGVIEEYSVSMDGVRQDFIIEQPPLNSPPSAVLLRRTGQLSTLNQRAGELQVRLDVTGAQVEQTAYGAQLVLEHSGRKIAYSRLRVTTEIPSGGISGWSEVS